MSSLSDSEGDDDDEEEDKPLAARMATKTAPDVPRKSISNMAFGKRTGKKASSMKSKAQTAPTATPSGEQTEMNGQANGFNGHETQIKIEEQMDESQLTRLATGVTVDTGGTANAAVRKILKCYVCCFFTSSDSSLPSEQKRLPLLNCAKALYKSPLWKTMANPGLLLFSLVLKPFFRNSSPRCLASISHDWFMTRARGA